MQHNTNMTSEILRKNTRQRSAIQDVIGTAQRPLLPMEILTFTQDEIPELGLATVYRNLKLLLQAGTIQSVDLPGAPPRYEIARQPHHHHFQCRHCEQVFDIPGCPTDIEMIAPPGFAVERHELTLYGVCASCKGAAAAQPPHRDSCC
jgi:Fur family ferric uptake transcriptional regulator